MALWVQVWASGMPIAFGVYVWACGTEFFTDGYSGFLTLVVCVILWPIFLAAVIALMLVDLTGGEGDV